MVVDTAPNTSLAAKGPSPLTTQNAASRRSTEQKEFCWSDEPDTAQGVVWGEQITNTIRKLKSLTFFAVGSKPVPPPQVTESDPGPSTEDKGPSKRKSRGAKVARKPRNTRPKKEKGGEAAPPMGADDTTTVTVEDPPPVLEPVFGLDDVANYECVSAEGIKMDMKDQIEIGVTSDRVEENERQRKRRGNDKPNNTYTEIITTALEEHPEGLTVSEIYEYISSRYGYYQPNDDRWKNSVRHNLSISPYFHKGAKSTHGAGHVWTIAEDCKEIRQNRRRSGSGLIPKFTEKQSGEPIVPTAIDVTKLKTETDFAVASILGDYTRACNGAAEKPETDTTEGTSQKQPIDVEMPQLEPEPTLRAVDDLGALDCSAMEVQYDDMQSFVSTVSTNGLLAMDLSEPNLYLLEDSGIVDGVEVGEGMILNLNSYLQPEELQAIFLDQSLSQSLSAMEQDSLFGDAKHGHDAQNLQN